VLLAQGLDTALLEIAIWGVGQPAIDNVLESLPITIRQLCADCMDRTYAYHGFLLLVCCFFAPQGKKQQTKR